MAKNPQHDPKQEFLTLVEAHQGIVNRVSVLYSASTHERDDLRQEILLQLWHSFPSFRGSAAFSTWMFRVALNTALLTRRRQRARPRTTELAESEPAPSAPDTDADLGRLQDCIRALPELDRAIILLYLERQPHDLIGELTGLSRKNVGVRVVRIKARLRACLEARRKDFERTS